MYIYLEYSKTSQRVFLITNVTNLQEWREHPKSTAQVHQNLPKDISHQQRAVLRWRDTVHAGIIIIIIVILLFTIIITMDHWALPPGPDLPPPQGHG